MSSLTQKSVSCEVQLSPRRRYSEADRTRFLEVLDRTGRVSAASAETGFNPSKCYAWARQTRPGTVPANTASPRGTINSKYTQSQKDAFFTELDRLGAVSAAARAMGFPVETCFQWACKAGVRRTKGTGDRRAQFLALRGSGQTQREAARAVGVNPRTGRDWELGVRRSNNKRYYPDGRVVDYKQGVTTFIAPAATVAAGNIPGLGQLQKPISSRYLWLPEREQIRDLRRAGSSLRTIARALGRPASSISCEITHNTGPAGYQPYAAHPAN